MLSQAACLQHVPVTWLRCHTTWFLNGDIGQVQSAPLPHICTAFPFHLACQHVSSIELSSSMCPHRAKAVVCDSCGWEPQMPNSFHSVEGSWGTLLAALCSFSPAPGFSEQNKISRICCKVPSAPITIPVVLNNFMEAAFALQPLPVFHWGWKQKSPEVKLCLRNKFYSTRVFRAQISLCMSFMCIGAILTRSKSWYQSSDCNVEQHDAGITNFSSLAFCF